MQHGGLSDALPVYEGFCIGAVRRDRHHAFTVHQVAVMGEDSWTQELGGGGGRLLTNKQPSDNKPLSAVVLNPSTT